MYLNHLECARCAAKFEADRLHNLCPACGSPLLARYDLERIALVFGREALPARPASMWRYRELLPVADERNIVTLGEGYTPLLRAERLGARLGLKNLLVKDESLNPTGSFKARGLSAAVSRALELGARRLCIPSAGNAAAALAAYAARAGADACIFMPEDAPEANKLEVAFYGAELRLVKGLITDAARAMRQSLGDAWFDLSTLREPYRVEGKKTMGYELAEQLGWQLPEVIIYPTGGGTGLIGMWKAFAEMEALGWIDRRRPRMIAVQSEGCAPIVRAFERGAESAEEWPSPETIAAGLRVPRALGDFLILRALGESGGVAVAVSDQEIMRDAAELAQSEGIFAAPEGAASLSALKRLLDLKLIARDERIVLFNTGSGLKYIDVYKRSQDKIRS